MLLRGIYGLTYLVATFALGCGGGSGFERVDTPPPSSEFAVVQDLWVFSESKVWVLDGTSTIHEFDGEAWQSIETESTGVYCIFALSETEVWMCAGNDILYYDGSIFTLTNVSSPSGLSGLSAIWASSPSDIWAVGEDARIAHYDGTLWTGRIEGSPFNSSIWGSGPSDIYVLGTFDLLRYDGSEWSEVDLDEGAGDGQVWGTGANDVWVMTDSERVSHFDGSSWEVFDNDDFIGGLATVWGPSADQLWAAGSAGAIATYNGSSWAQEDHQRIGAPYLRLFTKVHGSSADNVWMIGNQLGEGGSESLVYRLGN